ncbi:MAG: helix-turn-helix transcriptional regulator [bacterium]|nr:helix-turn-helix transcriptional regulator [bacterium]
MEQYNYTEYPVSHPLSPYIDKIWHNTQDQDIQHRIIPDNTVELIIATSSIIRQKTGEKESIEVKSHLAGLKTKAQKIQVSAGEIVGIRFKPEGLYPFVENDISEIINASVAPEMIFGNRFHCLEDSILESLDRSDDKNALVHAIENYFMEQVHHLHQDKLIDHVVQKIKGSNGNLPVSEIAKQMGCSIKTIERRFKQKVGLTPKKFCGLYRFHQSVLGMQTPVDKLSDIAYDFGYFDQMHFIKDVKKYAGLTPKNLFAIKNGLQQPTLNRQIQV